MIEGKESFNRNSVNALLGKLAHMMFSSMFRKAKDLGIHPGQVPICAWLYHHNGCRQKEIVEALKINRPPFPFPWTGLEKSGLITRKQDPQHPRVVKVYVTEKMEECYRALKSVLAEDEETLTSGFSPEEKELLQSYLLRMAENLERMQNPKHMKNPERMQNQEKCGKSRGQEEV